MQADLGSCRACRADGDAVVWHLIRVPLQPNAFPRAAGPALSAATALKHPHLCTLQSVPTPVVPCRTVQRLWAGDHHLVAIFSYQHTMAPRLQMRFPVI
jgi:hypothetical protein